MMTLKEARESGHRKYHGRPCKRCTSTIKYTRDSACVPCSGNGKKSRRYPGRAASQKARRRTAHQCRLASDHGVEIRAIYSEAQFISALSGIPHQVDHVIPLNHPAVCGLHVPWNLQILTTEANIAKSNQFEPHGQ